MTSIDVSPTLSIIIAAWERAYNDVKKGNKTTLFVYFAFFVGEQGVDPCMTLTRHLAPTEEEQKHQSRLCGCCIATLNILDVEALLSTTRIRM